MDERRHLLPFPTNFPPPHRIKYESIFIRPVFVSSGRKEEFCVKSCCRRDQHGTAAGTIRVPQQQSSSSFLAVEQLFPPQWTHCHHGTRHLTRRLTNVFACAGRQGGGSLWKMNGLVADSWNFTWATWLRRMGCENKIHFEFNFNSISFI